MSLQTILAQLQADVAALSNAVRSGATLVNPGDNLPSLLASATSGQVFVLDPLFAIDADIILTKPVTLQSAADYGPARLNAPNLPTIRGAFDASQAPGTILQGLKLVGLVKEATILNAGNNLVVNQCELVGSAIGQHRGIELNNSKNVVISKSLIHNIFSDVDAQAIAGDYDVFNLLVNDCYLEASGENVIFGGSDSPDSASMPQDIQIMNCTLTKQIGWKTQSGVTVKNLFELKCAQRVRFSHNICSYAWPGGGQEGYGLVLTVRNQNGSSPWTVVEDVEIEDNIFSHTGGGINILGSDDTYSSGQMARIMIRRNQFIDINPSVYGGSGRELMIGNGPLQLELNANLFSGVGVNSAITFTNAQPKNPNLNNQCYGLAITNCQFDEGDYGIFGDDASGLGKVAIDMYAQAYIWRNNAIKRGASGRTITYPSGTVLI